MTSKWGETGILRKKKTKENFDDLLVFGYACKLFRDDERALYIDQGKHLIPWMGDERLKIDRYDGRGALSDLSSCEASREGYDATRWLGRSEAERKLEQLCDEERYYSLHSNEEEDNVYKEEELKRQKANEFQYNYDAPAESEESNNPVVSTCEEEDKEFVPPKGLDVPVDIVIPKTVKENARIEKTAQFVSRQGPQMEILIKAKQSNNPQFAFMNKDDPLQKYYRHLLNSIKSGQYKPQEEGTLEENGDDNTASASVNAGESDHYLHPLLATTVTSLPAAQTVIAMAPPAPALQYKPTADCAYTQLVSRIKGSVEKHDETAPSTQKQEQEMSDNYNQYYESQYYQFYHQIAQQYATQGNCDINVILQNIHLQEQIQQQAVQYAQAACAQYTTTVKTAGDEPKPEPEPKVEQKEQKFSLVHYSSDSDDQLDEDESQTDEKSTFIIPPKDVALIVDKMATYVSKNGPSFEQSVKEKGDPRFDFLHDSHKYNKYYQYKVNEFRSKSSNISQSQSTQPKPTPPSVEVIKKEPEKEKPKQKESKVLAAVSFSIKKPKEEPQKDIKSALPLEESDEEGATSKDSGSKVPSKVQLVPKVENSTGKTSTDSAPITNGKVLSADSIIDMIDLTEEALVEKNGLTRFAEERIKDRLASAVRGRALQAERRKRAALFLKMQSERKADDKDERSRTDDATTPSESDPEEGEIKTKPKEREKRSKSKHKSSRSSKHRSSYSDSKSRHRKLKKRRYSPQSSSSSSSNSD